MARCSHNYSLLAHNGTRGVSQRGWCPKCVSCIFCETGPRTAQYGRSAFRHLESLEESLDFLTTVQQRRVQVKVLVQKLIHREIHKRYLEMKDVKREVHEISPYSQKKWFKYKQCKLMLKGGIYNRNRWVYLVPSWACEVTVTRGRTWRHERCLFGGWKKNERCGNFKVSILSLINFSFWKCLRCICRKKHASIRWRQVPTTIVPSVLFFRPVTKKLLKTKFAVVDTSFSLELTTSWK